MSIRLTACLARLAQDGIVDNGTVLSGVDVIVAVPGLTDSKMLQIMIASRMLALPPVRVDAETSR